ncbi:MAG: carbohydrate ABC transporter substrate-binding protein, partial [Chloroflexi bacterium]|nr:carbohydrate ABC transporter substrate-binding protein [Chloroflexota bacterium]
MNHKTVLRFVALVLVFALLGTALAQDPVEILYWDQVSGEDAQAVIETIIANFEEAHPNIKITREVYTLEQLTDIARTSIEAGEGPDILYYDSGPAYGGILGNAGLLLSLEEAYATYNWDERLVSVSRDWTTYG